MTVRALRAARLNRTEDGTIIYRCPGPGNQALGGICPLLAACHPADN